MGNTRIRLIIEGRVQGVWFRDSTRKEADRLGVSGWVKNRSDGTVEALVEGPEALVKELISWCRQGPPFARVDGIRETRETWVGDFDTFDIVY